MRVLLTGAAGFIGSAVGKRLLDRGKEVIGVDNLNNYYDVSLKKARRSVSANFTDIRLDISDREAVEKLFANEKPERVVNFAAQAGVRYAAKNPHAYTRTNVTGFLNVLEGWRHLSVEHLVYASSSSVYGANTRVQFSVHHHVDRSLFMLRRKNPASS